MKQTTKILIISIVAAGLVLAVYSSYFKQAPHPPESPDPPTALQNRTAPSTPSTEVATATKHAVAPSTTQPKASPTPSKHTELNQSIVHEHVYRLFAAPNDPRYEADWALQKVNAPAAWDITTGNNQTIIAVIDSGFALAHEDLASQWHSNPDEVGMTQSGDRCWTGTSSDKQTNNCDDDNNGYEDDWRGWNFALGDNNPQTGRTNPTGDGVRHGTMVAGLAGARGNNGLGMAALNWQTQIMPLQALDDDGIGYTSDVAAAIYYAVDNGAQVINISLGTYSHDPIVKAAIDYASSHAVIIVAAAGNCGDGDGDDCQGVPVGMIGYPAAYPDVIAVGASTQTDQRASFGSFGVALDVSAPGYNVPATTSWSQVNSTSLYATGLYGTSFASPQVASLASLIRSIRPNSSVQDITALIEATTSRPAGMNGLPYSQQFGHGIINAGAAIATAQALNTASSTPTLLQAGTSVAEHKALTNMDISSGCTIPTGTACTIQMIHRSSGHHRYLPYTLATNGAAGWTWSSNTLETGNWEIRSLSGDHRSTTPYVLSKFGT